MENKVDDEIRKRWEQEAKEQAEREAQEAQPKAKKRRAIEYNGATAAQYRAIGCDTEMAAINATLDMGLAAMRRQAPTRSTVGKRKATTGGVRTRGAAREDEEDTVVELD